MNFEGKKQLKQIQFIIDTRMIFSKEVEHGVFVNEKKMILNMKINGEIRAALEEITRPLQPTHTLELTKGK